MEKVYNFLRDINRFALSGQTLDKAHKPYFYIVCPCSASQQAQYENDMNSRILSTPEKSGERPFDPYKNWKTYFDAVNNCQNGLTPAYRLYLGKMGGKSPYFKCHNNNKGRMFCLSSAWGIVRSDFCLPCYNVSFGNGSPSRLRKNGEYMDPAWNNGMAMAFNHLAAVDGIIPIVMIGSFDYIKRFLFLCQKMKNPLIIFHNSKEAADLVSKYKNSRNGIGISEIRAAKAEGRKWYYEYMKII